MDNIRFDFNCRGYNLVELAYNASYPDAELNGDHYPELVGRATEEDMTEWLSDWVLTGVFKPEDECARRANIAREYVRAVADAARPHNESWACIWDALADAECDQTFLQAFHALMRHAWS